MTGLNHQKLNLQKRVEQEYRDQTRPSGSQGWFPNKKAWLKISFGPYKGTTIPTIFFRDPSYFFRELIWKKKILERSDYGKKLATQARSIGYKSKHIRPPSSRKNFVICWTHDGVFRRLKAIKNQPGELKALKKKYGSVEIWPLLNASVLYWKLKSDVERKRLAKDLVRIFLSTAPDRISSTDCGRFFDDKNNFEID